MKVLQRDICRRILSPLRGGGWANESPRRQRGSGEGSALSGEVALHSPLLRRRPSPAEGGGVPARVRAALLVPAICLALAACEPAEEAKAPPIRPVLYAVAKPIGIRPLRAVRGHRRTALPIAARVPGRRAGGRARRHGRRPRQDWAAARRPRHGGAALRHDAGGSRRGGCQGTIRERRRDRGADPASDGRRQRHPSATR